jgi:2-keto-3-deoxy-L-rhamnonate aldolase RhmA
MWKAVERVAKAAASNRMPWAILPLSAAHARRCVELGCRILSLGLDVWCVQKGIKAFKAEYAEFF